MYAVPKSKVSANYYETSKDTTAVIESFHEKIERIHLAELQEEALSIVRKWEENYLK